MRPKGGFTPFQELIRLAFAQHSLPVARHLDLTERAYPDRQTIIDDVTGALISNFKIQFYINRYKNIANDSDLLERVVEEAPSLILDAKTLNELAVELDKLCRLEEARDDCSAAVVSSTAVAYPKTKAKARSRPRSLVAYSKRRVADNLVQLPVVGHSKGAAHLTAACSNRAARVIDFQAWVMTRDSSAANKDRMTRQKIKRMPIREKRLRILDLISEEDMDDQTLASILEFLESLAPDIESKG